MIRRLKLSLLAALAITALGAIDAAGAHAQQFHCSVEPCKFTLNSDGEGKTAHHVFVVKNSVGESISFTCSRLTGSGTSSTKTSSELTVTGIAYDKCSAFGQTVNVRMNGCDYRVGSQEFVSGGTNFGARIEVACPGAQYIEIELAETGCTFGVTSQDELGLYYHNIGVLHPEVTAEAKVKVKVFLAFAGFGCGIHVNETPLTAEYTTGNTIATAETDPGGVMADGWWE